VTSESTQSLNPLREPTFYILLSLAPRPRHGYAILKDVSFLSEDRITLSTSTLYTALKRLLERGWIRREDDPNAGDSERERKFYRLTDLGQQVLEAEVGRLEALVGAAHRRAIGGRVPG
jgi:DNA-binding PadR family transcriptional regulator